MNSDEELRSNFANFLATWTKSALENSTKAKDVDAIFHSYVRIAIFNGVLHSILKVRLSGAAFLFALEAHNDFLVSHTQACLCNWRSSLQSLRSLCENTLLSLFYFDHPHQLKLWHIGEHRLMFSELMGYFENHPDLRSKVVVCNALANLKKEYATLSKAVHGSALSFRISDPESGVGLFKPDNAKLGAWSTRERVLFQNLVVVLMAFFRDDFSGTKNRPIREALSGAFHTNLRKQLKKELSVNVP